jgi:NTP pyrophosphatase (non-canonical NTP hydrolase)
MAQLTEEVGEVARIIARRYGEQSEKESEKNKDLGEELADVVLWFYVSQIKRNRFTSRFR